jgi:shikimate kinase
MEHMKKYNWLTSRFYNAVDIKLNEKPNVIMLSNCYYSEHTMLDPFTDSVQATGRFRNGVASIKHIVNVNPNLRVQTKEEVRAYVRGLEEVHKMLIQYRDTTPDAERREILQEYIDKNGVEAFLELEADIAEGIECESTVLATGGSAVLKERAANHLASLGTTVYISLPLGDIEKRITDLSSRGVAMSRGETLGDVYERRVPIYEKYADIKVDIKDKTIAESCAMLCEIIKTEAK